MNRSKQKESKLLAYNFLQSTVSAPLPFNEEFSLEVIASHAFLTNGILRISLDFKSQTATEIDPDPFSSAQLLSADGTLGLACAESPMSIVTPTRRIELDSTLFEPGTCALYTLASNGTSWFLFRDLWPRTQFARIDPDGSASHLADSDILATGHSHVLDRGDIPFQVFEDSVAVPSALDPSGRLSQAFNHSNLKHALELAEWNRSLTHFIMKNVLYDASTGQAVYQPTTNIRSY